MVELGAGVRPEEPLEVRVDGGPRSRLLLRVLHVGDRLPAATAGFVTHFKRRNPGFGDSLLVVEGDVGELLPARPVDGVGEPGVVRVQLAPVRQDLKGGE